MRSREKAGVLSGCLVSCLLAACIAPDVDNIGRIGLTVDEQHRPVLVLQPCDGKRVLTVDLSETREGLADDETNAQVGRWTLTEGASGGPQDFPLTAPPEAWEGPRSVALDRAKGYIASAGGGEKESLTQVTFRAEQLPELEPDLVYYNRDEGDLGQASREEFGSLACKDPGD